jgi:hypothetical protein
VSAIELYDGDVIRMRGSGRPGLCAISRLASSRVGLECGCVLRLCNKLSSPGLVCGAVFSGGVKAGGHTVNRYFQFHHVLR